MALPRVPAMLYASLTQTAAYIKRRAHQGEYFGKTDLLSSLDFHILADASVLQ